jgi:hypothetical protein
MNSSSKENGGVMTEKRRKENDRGTGGGNAEGRKRRWQERAVEKGPECMPSCKLKGQAFLLQCDA